MAVNGDFELGKSSNELVDFPANVPMIFPVDIVDCIPSYPIKMMVITTIIPMKYHPSP